MAFTDSNNGMVMPVTPMYGGGNNGGFGGNFGGDWGWIILLLLFAGGGWGMGGFGGAGNMMLGYDFPWLLNGQNNINANTNGGFRDAMLNDGITSIRDGISGLSTQLCGSSADLAMAIANGFAGVESGANTRQIADMQQMFGVQSALQNCCCENRSNIADLKYTVATENCADRQALSDGVRDIIANNTAQTQAILDKLCALELDGYKRENDNLRSQLNMATLNASQTAQTAAILQGQTAEVDALYNRLSNCPVPSTPVYGRTPIFTCNNNGCGCGNF